MAKKHKNYMDYIPVQNPRITWEVKEGERVELAVPNRGFFNRVAQLFFRRPKVSYIKLDEYGSFVWRQIDGATDIYAISQKMKSQFGEEAEPVVERLVQFMRALQVNRYIYYK